jgi:hypothetical protein
MQVLWIVMGVMLLAVAGTLALGFYALFRGGEFGRHWSNRLMRLRVALQLGAIIVLATIVLIAQSGHGH